MKRDDDYLRQLLFEIEKDPDRIVMFPQFISMPEEDIKRLYHAELLSDSGFLARISQYGFRLTNQGHDYIAAIRDEGVWAQTKRTVSETGGSATLDIIKQIAIAFLKKKISDQTGIDI